MGACKLWDEKNIRLDITLTRCQMVKALMWFEIHQSLKIYTYKDFLSLLKFNIEDRGKRFYEEGMKMGSPIMEARRRYGPGGDKMFERHKRQLYRWMR